MKVLNKIPSKEEDEIKVAINEICTIARSRDHSLITAIELLQGRCRKLPEERFQLRKGCPVVLAFGIALADHFPIHAESCNCIDKLVHCENKIGHVVVNKAVNLFSPFVSEPKISRGFLSYDQSNTTQINILRILLYLCFHTKSTILFIYTF